MSRPEETVRWVREWLFNPEHPTRALDYADGRCVFSVQQSDGWAETIAAVLSEFPDLWVRVYPFDSTTGMHPDPDAVLAINPSGLSIVEKRPEPENSEGRQS